MRVRLDSDFFSPPRPRAFGHRGAAGTHPENTMVSFQAAVGAGVAYLELDVHMTRDGMVVVAHDDTLERTCGVAGAIPEMDSREVLAADAGYGFSPDGVAFPFRGNGVRIPALAEVLGAFSGARFIVEVKQTEPSLTAAMLHAIDAAGMRRMVLVASEHQEPLDEIRALAPDIPTNLAYREIGRFMQAMAARDFAYEPPGEAIQIPAEYYSWRLVTPETVAMAHRHAVELHVWTVNEEREMEALLALGVDGVISDFPARLLRVIGRRRPLP
jgi:glycerophosphoryl diester phosphodiesterase